MASAAYPDLFWRPGLKLKDNRYEVLRKLSSGTNSSTWLVSDLKADPETEAKYHAAKILSLYGTELHRTGVTHELEILKIIKQNSFTDLPSFHEAFEIQGRRDSQLCILMGVMGPDVSSFTKNAPNKALKPYIVENIILQVLEALTSLHSVNIVHTDVNSDKIYLSTIGVNYDEVDQILAIDPPKIVREFYLDGEKYSILATQPIPYRVGMTWDAPKYLSELMKFRLVGLGQAQWAGTQPTADMLSVPALRAPELIIRSDFTPKIDVWAVGCLTFELLVGHCLFNPVDGGKDWRFEDDHLAKILELTGEQFSKSILDRAQLRQEYFNDEGNLLRITDLHPSSIEQELAKYKLLPTEEIAPAASFIKACLRLDPSDRPSTRELEVHPWLRGAFC